MQRASAATTDDDPAYDRDALSAAAQRIAARLTRDVMSADPHWRYVQARLQARHGDRLQEADWRALEAAQTADAFLERSRATSLRRFTEQLSAGMSSHAIERALRGAWRAYVDEVAGWLPTAWRPAVLWTALLPDLPAIDALLKGEAPAWTKQDPALALFTETDPAQRLAALQDSPFAPLLPAEDESIRSARAGRGIGARCGRNKAPPTNARSNALAHAVKSARRTAGARRRAGNQRHPSPRSGKDGDAPVPPPWRLAHRGVQPSRADRARSRTPARRPRAAAPVRAGCAEASRMSLRPTPAQWFELVTVHKELARVMECLSRTGAVELEARSSATDRLLFPGLDEALKAQRELARRYHTYWPAAAAVESRASEPLSETLEDRAGAARRLDGFGQSDHRRARAAWRRKPPTSRNCTRRSPAPPTAFPTCICSRGAGPKLQARLLTLPAGTLPREVPALVLYKPWQTPDGQLRADHRPAGRYRRDRSTASRPEGAAGAPARLAAAVAAGGGDGRRATADGDAEAARRTRRRARPRLSERLHIAQALGDVALIEWLNEHAKDLRGSERLAWVTGWTSDVSGQAPAPRARCMRRALHPAHVGSAGGHEPATGAEQSRLGARLRGVRADARHAGPARKRSEPDRRRHRLVDFRLHVRRCRPGRRGADRRTGASAGAIPLTRLLVPGGIMAIVFGFLFGSVFCREDIIPALWMHPLSDPITLLLVGVIAGMAIIAIGLLLDAVQMHWRGEAPALVGASRRPGRRLCRLDDRAAVARRPAGGGGRRGLVHHRRRDRRA